MQLELKYFDQVSRKGFGAIEVAIELCINLLLPDKMLIALLICSTLLLLLLLLVVGYFVVGSCSPGSCHTCGVAWAWRGVCGRGRVPQVVILILSCADRLLRFVAALITLQLLSGHSNFVTRQRGPLKCGCYPWSTPQLTHTAAAAAPRSYLV